MSDRALFLDWLRTASAIKQNVRNHFPEAARFRLQDGAADLLTYLWDRDSAEGQTHFLFFPSNCCWIEGIFGDTVKIQFGMLFLGEAGSISRGSLHYFHRDPELHNPREFRMSAFRIELDNASAPVHELDESKPQSISTEDKLKKMTGFNVAETLVVRLMSAVLTLLCSRRAYTLRQVELSKLNRRRCSRGKWPLLAYNEVRIAIAAQRPTVSPATGIGAERPLHFVRAFLRIRLGRMELVSPHWRGNAELGVKRPAYVITP